MRFRDNLQDPRIEVFLTSNPRLGSAGVKRAARLGMLFPGGLTRIFGSRGWLVVKMAIVSNAENRHNVFLQILWIFFFQTSPDLFGKKNRKICYGPRRAPVRKSSFFSQHSLEFCVSKSASLDKNTSGNGESLHFQIAGKVNPPHITLKGSEPMVYNPWKTHMEVS